MKDFFKELFAYSHDANNKFISVFEEKGTSTGEKDRKLMSHILNAHHIWNARVEQQTPVYAVWDIQPIASFRHIESINFDKTIHLLDALDLNAIIEYKTFAGISLKNSVRDILFHVVNHSTYHRAQVSMEWKGNGIDPIPSDYIFYKR